MPIFSRFWIDQQTGTGDPQGLRAVGAVLQVEISIPTALQQAQIAIPTPHMGIALIDTGASMTAVDQVALQQVGLNPLAHFQLVYNGAEGFWTLAF